MRPALLSQPGRDIIRPMMGIMAMGCITEALGFTHHAVIEAGDDSAGRRFWPGRARLPSCRPAAAATIYSCLPSPSISQELIVSRRVAAAQR